MQTYYDSSTNINVTVCTVRTEPKAHLHPPASSREMRKITLNLEGGYTYDLVSAARAPEGQPCVSVFLATCAPSVYEYRYIPAGVPLLGTRIVYNEDNYLYKEHRFVDFLTDRYYSYFAYSAPLFSFILRALFPHLKTADLLALYSFLFSLDGPLLHPDNSREYRLVYIDPNGRFLYMLGYAYNPFLDTSPYNPPQSATLYDFHTMTEYAAPSVVLRSSVYDPLPIEAIPIPMFGGILGTSRPFTEEDAAPYLSILRGDQ